MLCIGTSCWCVLITEYGVVKMAERKKKIKVRLRKMVYIVILLDKAFVGYIKSNRQFCSPGACYTIARWRDKSLVGAIPQGKWRKDREVWKYKWWRKRKKEEIRFVFQLTLASLSTDKLLSATCILDIFFFLFSFIIRIYERNNK